ncbi:hypothetical protein L227DRAFT_533408 [Lentinus tigrinus ALCF2SS1-6]|uniref:BRCT domain-containing protein n=1 Tax=Lentinus tigrinus ALCF2SS1-6 TaxID=1328759 RepID=A0A5C2RW67_9APHY|nr:hypothetical protein L227DRAFT_533408 [Lentinus tigrinus ALCF2SS1-6]
MALFNGKACFSPRVPPTVQREWVQNGGQIASVKHEDAHATHVFCDGSDDPWFCSLYKRSMAIFHWSWISAVVRAQFRLPISSYLIDADDLFHDDTLAYSHDSEGFQPEGDSQTGFGDPHAAAGWSPMERYSKNGEESFEVIRWPHRDVLPAPDGVAEGDVSFEGKTLVLDDPSSMIHSLPTSGMSVSEALEALKSVSVDGVVQFLPGTVHMGKEFRCSYAREFLRG